LRKRLKEKLTQLPLEERDKVCSSFDIIGDIAIIKHNNAKTEKIIANQILTTHKNVKTVFTPVTRITGDFRVRKLKLLAGENKTSTTHRELGCIFNVDVEKCYYSPRLSYEHSRIAELATPHEVVVNMFAGIGCFSIVLAKKQSQTKVYSIDINPVAFDYMQKNIKLNGVFGSVVPILGDSREIVEGQLQGIADRVLMPLPEKALEYLTVALDSLKKSGGWIHYYDFQHAIGSEDPIEKTKFKIAEKLDSLRIRYEFVNSRVVRPTGPNWYQTVIDIRIMALPSKF
jgi:tRNA (guanine37-N1)-methyltransferase